MSAPTALPSLPSASAPDPAARAALGLSLAQQGRLDEAVVHFRAALGMRPDFAQAHHNLGIALAQQGKLEEATCCLREAVRLLPGYAEAHGNLANVLTSLKQYDDAVAGYKEALRLKPDAAEFANNLGSLLTKLGRIGEAVVFLEHAVRLRPAFTEAHNNLGLARIEQGHLTEAESCYREALRHRPGDAPALSNLANVLKDQGRWDEAFATFELALWHDPDSPSIHWNRALAWLEQGDFEKGWAEYEWRWRRPQTPPRPLPFPAWDGAPLAGRSLLLYMEQGLGDMIQFLRYAPLVQARGGRVVVQAPAFLLPLFSTCPGIDELVAEGNPLPDCHLHAPLLSLPRLFGTTLETIPAAVPYLAADPERLASWRARLAAYPEFKVGVVWQGNPHHVWDRHRSVPLTRLAPLAAVPGVRLFSLQKGPGVEQIAPAAKQLPVTVLADQLDAAGGFLDTAAVMQCLDLVITVDTAAAHLAGALGVPVWAALARVMDWRWLRDREDSPWYPTMRLFRQPAAGDWGAVFRRMAAELQRAVQRRAVEHNPEKRAG